MQVRWNLDELLGYLRTWSACTRYEQARGSDPVSELAGRLAPLWGPAERERTVSWPLSMRVGRCGAGDAQAQAC